MNIKGLFLTALITFSATNITFSNQNAKQEDFEHMMDGPERQEFKEIYGGGIIPGAIIGYITGKISQYTLPFPIILLAIDPDNRILIGIGITGIAAILVAENIIRKKIVNDVNDNLEGRYIKNKKRQMETSARIASWVGLLL